MNRYEIVASVACVAILITYIVHNHGAFIR